MKADKRLTQAVAMNYHTALKVVARCRRYCLDNLTDVLDSVTGQVVADDDNLASVSDFER